MLDQKGVPPKSGNFGGGNTLNVPKKSKAWIFKLILIVIIAVGLYYLFINRQDLIIDPVNKFFERFS